jgi:hypothetical protein
VLKNVLNYIRERCAFRADSPGDSEHVGLQKKIVIHMEAGLSTDSPSYPQICLTRVINEV